MLSELGSHWREEGDEHILFCGPKKQKPSCRENEDKTESQRKVETKKGPKGSPVPYSTPL